MSNDILKAAALQAAVQITINNPPSLASFAEGIEDWYTFCLELMTDTTAAAAPVSTPPPPPASRLEALRQAVRRKNFVILDTETTGLNDGEICQIAIIDQHGQTLLDTLVKPVNGIPADATQIHGITTDMVTSAPGWSEVAPQVRALLTGRDVIVYNAVYDRKMMHKSAEAAGMEKIDWKAFSEWVCAMEAYAEYYGDWNDYRQSFRWQKLIDAARNCSVAVSNAHSALGDCLMTLGVVRFICEGEQEQRHGH
ncbi:MAG: 3'-5' exonuclease [Anaerolineae bacterium]|nr:3'-5' exonuclease [Anaerolineae bacterium]